MFRLALAMVFGAIPCVWSSQCSGQQTGNDDPSRPEVTAAMKRAADYFRNSVGVQGGYVYYYSLDLSQRWGEGKAAPTQVWVQPPGTPSVGLAYLDAYRATKDPFYLECAVETAGALTYGQLKSGGWTNYIDFDPNAGAHQYRGGSRRGKNNSSLDDGQSQTALLFLTRLDGELKFENHEIHEATQFAWDALLNAQFPNGGFPQVWTGPVERREVMEARYPQHDWRTEGRIKNYWDMYTLNDNVCGYVAEALIEANRVYEDDRYLQALRKLGDFLVLAQMPDPQPAWAQQYNERMEPIWARRFEPAAIASDETQEALQTLMQIYEATGDERYLEPCDRALEYLRESQLADGTMARFYELETNRPLYMRRRGDEYSLTYDDSDLPSHYGWKISSRVDRFESRLEKLSENGRRSSDQNRADVNPDRIRQILSDLDQSGRWIDVSRGQSLVGQPKFPEGERFISSQTFAENLSLMCDYLTEQTD